TEVFWTPGDQADWEAALARLTASAGLPLWWAKNPEWKKLCDCFLTKAKNPSLKVLTNHLIPDILNWLKASAEEECWGSEVTLQCDGWTGENHHHLIGFMMTSQQKLYTIHVHDTSKDLKTAKELLNIEMKWGAIVIACTVDTS
ncbi:hypothetical protein PAXRUDRAFT_150555, partial [Paxillus rubicundulus Ve08.2h10]